MRERYSLPKENKLKTAFMRKALKRLIIAVDEEAVNFRTGKELNERTRFMREDQ